MSSDAPVARPLPLDRLDEVAALIARHQQDPSRHIGYLSSIAEAVAEELRGFGAEQVGAGAVVLDDDGAICGVLVPEWDTEPPRVWWHGPFVEGPDWQAVADALYAQARPCLPDFVSQEEMCGDAEHRALAEVAARHGFVSEEAAAVLNTAAEPASDAPAGLEIESVSGQVPETVIDLHRRTFPHAHRVGAALADDGMLLVARRGEEILGYARAELQSDGGGYLDLLAVEPGARGQGIGGALVAAISSRLLAQGCTGVHLTVRESNRPARRLYERLGFTEERLLVPYRRGWRIDSGPTAD